MARPIAALTCESFFDTAEWIWLFQHFGYTGDYESNETPSSPGQALARHPLMTAIADLMSESGL